jgi:hypothetical protein
MQWTFANNTKRLIKLFRASTQPGRLFTPDKRAFVKNGGFFISVLGKNGDFMNTGAIYG